ncbi:glycosyltransferase family 1 protein [Patescibacteria group bacterium]|nr:MAG: glycosyltransferase family 1 protein [Patescibacteria group bacterium]
MKILWFTWKDKKNLRAGGAELVNEEIAKRLVRDGHEVIFLVAGFPGAKGEEIIDGYKVIRVGEKFSVYWQAYRYYNKHLGGWADLVIEEINTMPFFTNLYIKDKPVVFLFYQLCREIWFHQMMFPGNVIGYVLEPLYLRFLAKRNILTLTESESAKVDLARYGFNKNKIKIFNVGIELEPVANLENIQKHKKPTLLSLGAIRKMKRTDHQIRAFEIAKKKIPDLQLKVAGDSTGRYRDRVIRMMAMSPYAADIEYLGRVSSDEKNELMRTSHLIMVTSVKEGWGIIVTEANSQGTPAVAYDVDGLRDSVRHGETGLIAKDRSPEGLAEVIVDLLGDDEMYRKFQKNAWEWSQEITFENGYRKFVQALADQGMTK